MEQMSGQWQGERKGYWREQKWECCGWYLESRWRIRKGMRSSERRLEWHVLLTKYERLDWDGTPGTVMTVLTHYDTYYETTWTYNYNIYVNRKHNNYYNTLSQSEHGCPCSSDSDLLYQETVTVFGLQLIKTSSVAQFMCSLTLRG